ncbi:MAG: Ig-like domain-containing protein [Myxococcales bacterium]|nr:Ig-like domain-containing protein [Myxococcales bacterium]
MGLRAWAVWSVIGLALGCTGGGGGGGGGEPEDMGPSAEAMAAAEGLTGIVLAPASARLTPGVPRQFTAYGEYEGGEPRDITALATWTSTAPEVAEISNEPGSKGLATVHGTGAVTFRATLGEVHGELSFGGGCDYPEEFDAHFALGEVVAPFGFEPAYGANGEAVPFDMRALHCDESVRTFVFMFGTGWCGACSAMAQRLSQENAAIEAAGGKVILVELEDADSAPVDSDGARQHWDRLIGAGSTIVRVGDQSSTPGSNFVTSAARNIISGYPTTMIVRRSDMRIIAVNQPIMPVVSDPEADWTEPFIPPFTANCGPAQEEPGEPNDTPEQATPIAAGEFNGGICTPAPDFFQVDIDGPWRLTLNFTHSRGDLDVFVWDVTTEGPLQQNGQPVGSANIANQEQFEFAGPALVQVAGYQNASAEYRLTLEAL